MTIKIAVIGTRGVPATYGGIEKHCEELYSRLIKRGYEVVIYARNYYVSNNIKEFKGIKIKNVATINIKGFETLIHSFFSTILATFSDADIIHFHAQGPTIFSWIPRLLAPKKIVGFTCHGIDWQRDKWNWLGRFTIKLGEISSAMFPHFKIAVSQYLVDYYRTKYNVQVQKIYNGVNIPVCQTLFTTNKHNLIPNEYFLFVGRLVPEKAPEIIIKAFKNLKTDKKFVIVGDSADTNTYVSELKNLAHGDNRIIFTSYLYGTDLEEIYSNALAYITASKLEGLPLTVLEAMSYSLPIIVSDIQPHTEIISLDKSIGFQFKVNDTLEAQKAIEKLLNLPSQNLELMGRSAKNVVSKHFNWDNVTNETLTVYEKYCVR